MCVQVMNRLWPILASLGIRSIYLTGANKVIRYPHADDGTGIPLLSSLEVCVNNKHSTGNHGHYCSFGHTFLSSKFKRPSLQLQSMMLKTRWFLVL